MDRMKSPRNPCHHNRDHPFRKVYIQKAVRPYPAWPTSPIYILYLVSLLNADIKNSASGNWFYTPHLAYDSRTTVPTPDLSFLLQPPIQRVLETISLRLKQPDLEADLSPSSGSETSTHDMQDVLWSLQRQKKIYHVFYACRHHTRVTGVRETRELASLKSG